MDQDSPTGSSAPIDVLIVGAGAAGILAALGARAAVGGERLTVRILEKMNKVGRKIAVSGGGRCNFTNTLDARRFVELFGRGGRFLGAALKAFPNQAIVDLLGKYGVVGEVEQAYRLYTASGRGQDVVDALLRELATAHVPVDLNTAVTGIETSGADFVVHTASGPAGAAGAPGILRARSLVIAVGGASYPKLGSTGDGYGWARQFGHTVTPLQAALVGVCVAELPLCKFLQGVRIEQAAARLFANGTGKAGKPLATEPGDLLFAHFGLTGPALLDLSLSVVAAMADQNGAATGLTVGLDLWPDIEPAALRQRVDETLKSLGAADRTRAFEERWPKRLRQALWAAADPTAPLPILESDSGDQRETAGDKPQHLADHPASRTPAALRDAFVRTVKDWRFTLTGTRELEVGEVTDGGVALDEIDKSTMMSLKQPGLFLCGEILDLTGRCGGFNLQAAWSTGYLAGRSAATLVQTDGARPTNA